MRDDAKIAGERRGHGGDFSRAQAEARSANSAKDLTGQLLSVRRTSPARMPPGPSSQNSVAPAAFAPRRQSSQRTEETSCWTSAALMAAGSEMARPVVFVKTAKRGGAKEIPSRYAEK